MFELRNRSFYKKTVILMLPVILQQLITIGINFMDNLMVGSFGETQIAAAALGNQFYSFFQFICMGLGSGAVVMSSQFWGRKELEPMKLTAAIAMRLTVAVCAVFTVVSVAFPAFILGIYTNESAVIREGTPYLRLIGCTFMLTGLASTSTYLMRSVGHVKTSLIGSCIAFFVNIFFNWVFIFGKLGASRLEIVGAAVGTVIARAFECCFVFGYFILKDKKFAFRPRHFALSGKSLRSQYIRFSIPVLVSDLLLGLSLTITSVIMGHVGETITAAHSIVNTAIQLVMVINMGMAGASAIVIGNTIGEGNTEKAKSEGYSYTILSLCIGLVLIPILILLEKPYLSLYTISEATRAITHGMIIINCFMMPFQTIAYTTSKGILRGGGDTRFLLLADSSLVWLISIPLGALSGLVWRMDPTWVTWVFFFLRVEYPLKGIVCLIRFLSGKWIKEVKVTA